MTNAHEVFYFPPEDKNLQIDSGELLEKVGVRGTFLQDLASIGLPIAPAVIFTSDVIKTIRSGKKLESLLDDALKFLEKQTKKKIDDPENPLFCKVVLSPSINISYIPSVHNVGLTKTSFEAYAKRVGEPFVIKEWATLLESIEKLGSGKTTKTYSRNATEVENLAEDKAFIDEMLKKDPKFNSVKDQYLKIIYAMLETFYKEKANHDIEVAVIIQAMVYGNWDQNSLVGRFTTRDPSTGKNEIGGKFVKNHFTVDDPSRKPEPFEALEDSYKKQIAKYAKHLEEKFLEIREVNFCIENGVFWVIDQRELSVATQAQMRLLLDLRSSGLVNDSYLIGRFQPKQLLEFLHARLKKSEGEDSAYRGGIAGSPGAAVGKVYFSTPSFLSAFADAKSKGHEPRQILAMRSTYAEDVQAIELGVGVISSEGGFSSHAPVVARSFGKPAMVDSGIEFQDGKMVLSNGMVIKEGQEVSFEASYDQMPILFPKALDLAYPDIQKNGLSEFITYLRPYTDKFKVRVNADQARDAKVGRVLGAEGIGLCRTEHMFFDPSRIMKVRQMLLARDTKERIKVLEKIRDYQKLDFIALFQALEGEPLNVRLLDAPLHEFLPKNEQEFEKTYHELKKEGLDLTIEEARHRFSVMHEVNPMLGHRGCRIAVTYNEIYLYQMEALLEAALEASKTTKVALEVMIPMVMTDRELDLIINGKEIEGEFSPGLISVEEKVLKNAKLDKLPFEYKWGTMIELPIAAISAETLVHYTSYFSFGTNDLTQTTLGLSRDDINSFYSDYSKFDIFEFNPFQKLNFGVKELILMALRKGRMVRPDLKAGICGEHGADPDAVLFSIQNGLDYVSCSPYSVPIALLTIARHFVQTK